MFDNLLPIKSNEHQDNIIFIIQHSLPDLVSQVVGSGIAGSDYFRLLADSVLQKTPSPGGLGQMCKDVSIVVNTTRDANLPAYVANATAKYFLQAETPGMQDREGADLIEVVENPN